MHLSSLLRKKSHGYVATALLALLFAVPSAAQQQSAPNAAILVTEEEEIREYSVEMIVFEYVGSAAGTSEIFEADLPEKPVFEEPLIEGDLLNDLPTEFGQDMTVATEAPGADDGEEAFELLPREELELIPTFEQSGLKVLPAEEFQLNAVYRKLSSLDAYRPLMHTAWVQPTLELEDTNALSLRRIGDPPLRLDGSVTLYLSRFLHLVIDLSLEQRNPQLSAQTGDQVRYYGDSRSRASLGFGSQYQAPSVIYRIQEDRIVRNNELRYFDHPKFGVVAKITRIEEEEPEAMDTTGDLLPAGIN